MIGFEVPFAFSLSFTAQKMLFMPLIFIFNSSRFAAILPSPSLARSPVEQSVAPRPAYSAYLD